MTAFSVIYNAFLSKILEDEWEDWQLEEAEEDWRSIMESALPWFKFPKHSLERSDDGFSGDLSPEEIQIIANYMKCEWLNRCIMTWDNIKALYDERDFSPANFLDKLNKRLSEEQAKAEKLESLYYRSPNHRPFDFSQMAGA